MFPSKRFSTLCLLTRRVLTACLFSSVAMHAHAFEAPNDGVYKDRIDWGIINDLSGPTSSQGSAYALGLRSYLRTINENGGIHGRRINPLVEDDRYDAVLTRTTFEKLANQTPVLGMSGFGTSSGIAALMPQVRRGKVAIISAMTTTTTALEPPTPQFYSGFCDFNSMAKVAVGHFSDLQKKASPAVAIVYLDVASGKDFLGFAQAEVTKRGGTFTAIPIKVGAADATAQVLAMAAMKPDFVAMHGITGSGLVITRAMQQQGVNVPVVMIAHQGVPQLYQAVGQDAGKNLHHVSCFTPGSADNSPGVVEMRQTAEKYGHGTSADDGMYVAGWSSGYLVAEAIRRAGKEPTREKLVANLNSDLTIDTRGVSGNVSYGPNNKAGTWGLRVYSYDYQAKRFKAHGNYADYAKYLK